MVEVEASQQIDSSGRSDSVGFVPCYNRIVVPVDKKIAFVFIVHLSIHKYHIFMVNIYLTTIKVVDWLI